MMRLQFKQGVLGLSNRNKSGKELTNLIGGKTEPASSEIIHIYSVSVNRQTEWQRVFRPFIICGRRADKHQMEPPFAPATKQMSIAVQLK